MPRWPLPPMYPWPGGAVKLAKTIVSGFPPHDTYVEPFFGGGNPFFAKEPAPLEVINDLNPVVPRIIKQAQRGELRRCKPRVVSRGAFQRACGIDRGQSKNLCDFIACAGMSFDGNRKDLTGYKNLGKVKGQRVHSLADDYAERLRGVKVHNWDYIKAMLRYDSPQTLHFLDPPWPGEYAKRRYVGFHDIDPAGLKYVTDQMQGKVMILYGENPEVHKVFCTGPGKYHCTYLDSAQSSGGYGGGGHKRRLIASKGFKPRFRRKR